MVKLSENRKFALALSVGTVMTSNIVGGIALGYFLDRWLHTAPWMIVTFLILGTVSAFIGIYRIVSRLE